MTNFAQFKCARALLYAQKLINEPSNCTFLTSAYRWKLAKSHNFSCASSLLHFAYIEGLAFFKPKWTCSVLPT